MFDFHIDFYMKLSRRQSVRKDGTETKTPRYEVTAQAGYFKPLEAMKDAKGRIVMYYQRNDKCNPNSKSDTRLQCRDSINFSSVYFLDLRTSGALIGYGEPPFEKMLKPSKKTSKTGSVTLIDRANPFYENRGDGYLFVVSGDDAFPESIEILVVSKARYMIQGIAKQLAGGLLDDVLKQTRDVAKSV
jgi:hypothetical protein